MINDLKKMENLYQYKNELKEIRIEYIDKYYNFLKLTENNINKLEKIVISLSNMKKKKKFECVKHLEIIISNLTLNNYLEFEKARNSEDLAFFLISFSIIRIFYELNLKTKEEEFHQITEYDLVDKISEVIYNFLIWYELNLKIEIKNNDIENWKDFIRDILLKAKDDNIIKLEMIRLFNTFKTSRCYEIDIDIEECRPTLGLSKDKYNIHAKDFKNIYGINSHYSMTFKILKPNYKSNAFFKIEFNSKVLNNLSDNWVYLDKVLLKEKINILCTYYKININEISNDFNMYKKELKYSIKNKNKNLTSLISKKISLYQYLIKLNNLLWEPILCNEKIYLNFKFDFRGRLYFLSSISPTNDKIMRYCIHWGYYENLITKEHFLNKIIENEIDKYIPLIDEWDKYNFKGKNIYIKRGIIWLLISVAEINKTGIGSKIKIKEFIIEGKKIIDEYSIENFLEKDIDDILKINYFKNILEEINKNIYIKRLIAKDATASCYQHLIKALGPKSEDSLKWCNLSSYDTWYDTYSFIIKNFTDKKRNFKAITEEIFKDIFKRKPLKKTIMTINYGASERTCWNYFLYEFEKNNYSYDEISEIKKIFSEFYKTLITNDSILSKSTKEITNFFEIENNRTIKLIDKCEVNLEYYKSIKKQKETLINGVRYTTQKLIITDKYDNRKRKLASRANYVQSIDACLVRWYLSTEKGITIHDSFLIDYLNTTYLVSKINEGMRITFHDLKIDNSINTNLLFSIFIIL